MTCSTDTTGNPQKQGKIRWSKTDTPVYNKYQNESAVVVVSDSAWLAGIVGLLEDVDRGVERCIVHGKPPCGLK